MKNFLDYHFYVVFHTVITEVFPLNWLECSLVDEMERNQVFYRRKFSGKLTFGGKKLKDDYDLFYNIHIIEPCERLELLILRGVEVYYESYFCTSDGEWNYDDCTFTVNPLPIDDYYDWADIGDYRYNLYDVVPVITVICNGVTYTRNRFVLDCIEFLADKVFPGCTVVSTFLSNAINYVTLDTNTLRYLTIAQKSDIKRPTSDNPATIWMMSLNEFMTIMRMFNVFWKYDLTTNIFTVEHVSLFTALPVVVDLRTQDISRASNKYRYQKENMPKYEAFNFMESDFDDFVRSVIYYDSTCVDQDPETNISEYTIPVTTDIEFIQDNSDEVSDDGYVILANYISGGNYMTYFLVSYYGGDIRYNMHLAWTYLLDYYHKHNRVMIEGYMNNSLQTFYSAKKTKVQEINAIICPAYLNDPRADIRTELGQTYFGGIDGAVQKAVIKPYDEVNFSLLYGEPDNPNPGIPSVFPCVEGVLTFYSFAGGGHIDSMRIVFTFAGEAPFTTGVEVRERIYDDLGALNCTGAWNAIAFPIGDTTVTFTHLMCEEIYSNWCAVVDIRYCGTEIGCIIIIPDPHPEYGCVIPITYDDTYCIV